MLEPHAETIAAATPQAAGCFVPPALEQAFNTLVDAGLGPRQLRAVETLFTEAIDQILGNAATHHPEHVGVLARHLFHLRAESVTPAASLLGGEQMSG